MHYDVGFLHVTTKTQLQAALKWLFLERACLDFARAGARAANQGR